MEAFQMDTDKILIKFETKTLQNNDIFHVHIWKYAQRWIFPLLKYSLMLWQFFLFFYTVCVSVVSVADLETTFKCQAAATSAKLQLSWSCLLLSTPQE